MAILTQSGADLSQAIGNIGNVLGEVLQQRRQMNQQQGAFKQLQGMFPPDSTLGKILSNPQISQAFSSNPGLMSLIAPLIKEEARSEGMRRYEETFNTPLMNLENRGGVPGQPTGGAIGYNTPQEQSRYQQPGVEESVIQSEEKSPFFDVTSMSDTDIVKLSGSPYQQHQQIAKTEIERRKLKSKEFRAEREYHTQQGKKSREFIDSLEESVPRKLNALQYARNAVESQEVGAFSRANLARIVKRPELQTAEGAALITASKENLLSNMARVSARAQNQWFEQRLNSMFPQIGQSQEANLTALEMLEGEALTEKLLEETYNRIANEDKNKYGYVKEDALKRARKDISSIENKIFERSVYRMKQLEEQQAGDRKLNQKVGKQVPKGTPFTLTMAQKYIDRYGDTKKALKVAKKNGYSVPSKNDYEFYSKSLREIQ